MNRREALSVFSTTLAGFLCVGSARAESSRGVQPPFQAVQGDNQNSETTPNNHLQDDIPESDVYIAELAGGDGVIKSKQLQQAVEDWRNEKISIGTVQKVLIVWKRDDGKLNGDINISFKSSGNEYEVSNGGEETVQVTSKYLYNNGRWLQEGEHTAIVAAGDSVVHEHPQLSCDDPPENIDISIDALHWDAHATLELFCTYDR